MKKILTLALAMVMLVSTAMAAPLELGAPLEGICYYPEASNETNFAYSYAYLYPSVVPQNNSDNAINEFFDYQMNDALSFTAPLNYQDVLDSAIESAYTKVTSQVTCNTDDYFSVLVTLESQMGATASQTWVGYTFGRTGDDAGMVVSLADVLGLSVPSNDDGFSYERATQKSETLIYELVWDIICVQIENGTGDYFENLSLADLSAEFYPDSDFYMDADGNIVFYIQPAMIASHAAGMLTFPFSVEELLSEL